MERQELTEYRHIIDSLLYISSSIKLKEAIDSFGDSDKRNLYIAMDLVGKSFLEDGHEEDYELLMYIKNMLGKDLSVIENQPVKEIIDSQTLIGACLGSTSVFRIRTLLTKYRHLLTGEVLRQLQIDAVADSFSNPALLTIFCIAAIIQGTPEWFVRSKFTWASKLRKMGSLNSAERHLGHAKNVLENINDPGLRFMVLATQVGIYRAKRDLLKAMQVLEEMVDASDATTDYYQVISLHTAISQIAFDLGQHSKSLDHLNKNILLLEKVENPLSEEMMKAYELRGSVYERMGNYEMGFSDYQFAYNIATAIGDRGYQFANMNNMAASLAKRSLYQQSLNRFRKVLQTVSEWGNPVMIASTHNNIGQMLLLLKRPAEALSEFQKALKIKINSNDKNGESITFFGMSDAMNDLRDFEGAKTWLTLGLMPGLETGDVDIIAQFAFRLKNERHDGAGIDVETLRWALGIAKASQKAMLEIILTDNICKELIKGGDMNGAIDLYESFFREHKGYSVSAPEYVNAIASYATALASIPDRREEALDLLMSGLRSIQKEIKVVLYGERRAEIISSSIVIYSTLFTFLLDGNNAAGGYNGIPNAIFAFDIHESAKSRSFLSHFSSSMVETPASVPIELKDREAALLLLEQSYQDQEEAESEAYRMRKLSEVENDLHECWEAMKPFAPDYVRFRSGEPYTFEEMQKVLSVKRITHLLFVSFFCDDLYTTAFVITPGCAEPFVFRTAVGSRDIEEIARRLNRTFNGDPEDFPPYPPILRDKPEKRSLDFFYQLSDRLLQFLSIAGNAGVIYIAPHGPLHSIPFHALKMRDGSYLASHFEIIYTPSLSILMLMIASNNVESLTKASVFVAGISAEGDSNPQYFEEDMNCFEAKYFSVTSRTGIQNASRNEILKAFPDYDIIHLSCHGYFDKRDPLHSGLLFSNGHSKPPRDPRATQVMERSKYLVTAREVLKTRSGSQLVTLNACSTGMQGQRNAGDEMDGLNRSFLLSGTATVLSTLWNVDQESSLLFFEKFYQFWVGNGTFINKSEALKLAQSYFIQSEDLFLRHPYHWAAFTLNGNWR
jgi:tetratricopeptide (TPR) repeat protein